MFALSVLYLTGRVVATDAAWRGAAEWPPHPARLFFALVDALHRGGNKVAEREALQWLERQCPPALSHSEASWRDATTSYVPVNDNAGQFERDAKEKKAKFYPEIRSAPAFRRLLQPRTFLSVAPQDPVVYFVWPDSVPPLSVRAGLASLASRIARLGHSSSLVCIRVCDTAPKPRLVPSADGATTLRMFGLGTLEAAEDAYNLFEESGQRLPVPLRSLNYHDLAAAAPMSLPAHGVFSEMFIFARFAGPRLPIQAAPTVAAMLRDAALANATAPMPEALSGHRIDGAPSHSPHVAFAALPDVDHPYADGQLLGVAAILPREITPPERDATLRAFGKIRELRLGRNGVWRLERVAAETNLRGLRPETWIRPSICWSSITPVVLDRFPKRPFGEESAQIIATACQHAGLPRPARVTAGPLSRILGVPSSFTFRPLRKAGMPVRFHVHVELAFPTLVSGPVVIGAGRYRGYGICRQLSESTPTSNEA